LRKWRRRSCWIEVAGLKARRLLYFFVKKWISLR
jgi:hypothetical protein